MSVEFRKRGFVLCLLLAASSVRATESLSSVYEVARAQSPELQMAQSMQDAVIEKREQAGATRLPSVRFLSDAGRQQGASAFEPEPFQDRVVRNWSWTLQLTQALLRPGASEAVKQADLEVLRAAAELQRQEQELMIRVSQAVLDRLTAQFDVSVAVAHQRAVEQHVQQAKHSFSAGLSTVTDVHDATVQLHLVEAQLFAARSALTQREAELERVLGAPLEALPVPAEPLKLRVDKVFFHSDGVLDAEVHPAVVAQHLAVRVAELEVQKQTRAHGPTLDMTLGYGRSSNNGSMTSASEQPVRSRGAQANLRLSIPLYEGGAVFSRVREAEHLREKQEAELKKVLQQIRTQARQAHTAMVHDGQRIDALELALKVGAEAVAATRVGYRIGTRIGLDVLNAEHQRFTIERDLYRASAERVMNGLRLKAARGVLSTNDLASIAWAPTDKRETAAIE